MAGGTHGNVETGSGSRGRLPAPSSHTTVRTVRYTAVHEKHSGFLSLTLEEEKRTPPTWMVEPSPRRTLHVPCPLGARYPYPRRFRRLLSGLAPASQPSCLRLLWTSNAPCRFGPSCSALHRSCAAATTASADFCPPIARPCSLASLRQTNRSPGVRRVTFAPSNRRIYARQVRVASGFESHGPLAHLTDASYAVCVPRARALPAASFPRYLTAAQLLFS